MSSGGPQGTQAAHRDYIGAKIGMWLFLITEVLLFGGMFLLYSVYRSRFAADFHEAAAELDVVLGAANTIILLTSSLTIAMSITALQRGRARLSAALQGATVIMGLVFLINKYFEWSAKFDHGLYIGSEHLDELGHGQTLFYSLYYVMTGLHGVHVLVGMVVITVVLAFTLKGIVHKTDYIKLENAGLYWHLVDVIWIYLFPLFYLVT